jgi:hypothetical protein
VLADGAASNIARHSVHRRRMSRACAAGGTDPQRWITIPPLPPDWSPRGADHDPAAKWICLKPPLKVQPRRRCGVMREMRAFAVIVAMLAGLSAARAEPMEDDLIQTPPEFIEPAPPRRPPVVTALVLRVSDAGRWELCAGAAGGWRPLFDLHLRYYVSDAVTLGPRLRLDLDGGAPRGVELSFGNAIGNGKMRFPGEIMTRTRLVLGWGNGVVRIADRYGIFAFVGLSLRVQPSGADWQSFELGARAALTPREVPVAARSTSPPPSPPELEAGFATELGASVAILWPRPRRECVRLPR